MPLVTPGSQNSIDILFQAQTDNLIAESNRVIAKVEEIKQAGKAKSAELLRQGRGKGGANRKKKKVLVGI